ncbi:TIGR01244 family sulfur transferase [Octadecabacter ascidiaceicola]|uniref:Beta-lactamase hydrolase-like protein n=1 Tax=Octadecabacter ascidiaceicola TaxID=1655543 RepID=A0A238K5S4_9RHOB|nr:TIGR01244 family sulfur transferase [Octadecabacter ascidiaceicola]SMX38133.1 Beta-lactamase hydrolase-like protein [Octadecabacter ascidiaceicola]
MDIRQLTPDFAVSPQIDPQDLPAIAEQGFTTIVVNRPDAEVPPSHQVDAMQAAASAAGVELVVLPVTHITLSPDMGAQLDDARAKAKGPVLAYCASGTRSAIVWALSQAGKRSTDEITEIAAQNGYDLSMMRSQLDALAGS